VLVAPGKPQKIPKSFEIPNSLPADTDACFDFLRAAFEIVELCAATDADQVATFKLHMMACQDFRNSEEWKHASSWTTLKEAVQARWLPQRFFERTTVMLALHQKRPTPGQYLRYWDWLCATAKARCKSIERSELLQIAKDGVAERDASAGRIARLCLTVEQLIEALRHEDKIARQPTAALITAEVSTTPQQAVAAPVAVLVGGATASSTVSARPDRSSIQCYYCHMYGHMQRSCKKRFEELRLAKQQQQTATTAVPKK